MNSLTVISVVKNNLDPVGERTRKCVHVFLLVYFLFWAHVVLVGSWQVFVVEVGQRKF